MQSGSRARSSSVLVVALTPVDGRPAISPASTPTLPSVKHFRPTSSRSGLSMTNRRAWRPTAPVPHCTTRCGMAVLLVRSGLDPHGGGPGQDVVGTRWNVVGGLELHVRELVEEDVERHSQLEPGQCRPEAEVGAVAE